MTLPKSLTTVTTLSKTLAMILFIAFPFIGFYAGMQYEKKLSPQPAVSIPVVHQTAALPTATLTPSAGCYYKVCNIMCTKDNPNCCRTPERLICPTLTPTGSQIVPSCKPRPACLDATPRCMIPETSDMCPKAINLTPAQTVCTQEALQCPDGSYVGRTGPKCEFARCPVAN